MTAVMSGDAGGLDGLRQAVSGRLSTRATDRLAMAHDASHYLLTPRAVVTPRHVQDLSALLRSAAQTGIALTFRSGGTSLSGQAGTDQILVDTRRHFRDITVLDQGQRVRVQPGATVRQVNARLASYGYKLGPDPASEAACTIGGVVANNSSGMACGTEYNTYRTLQSATLILPSGTVINTADRDADRQLAEQEPRLHAGLRRLRDRIRGNAASVHTITQQFSIKNTMGYGINAFLDHTEAIDILLHLVIGSEGTLAFVAEATFRTVPIKPHVATGLLLFPELRQATDALPDLVATGLATIELMDATSLQVAQLDPQATDILLGTTIDRHAALLVEFQEPSRGDLERRIQDSQQRLAQLPLCRPASMSGDLLARNALWHIRKGLYATVAGNRPSGTTALLEDIAVPVASLAYTCEQLVELFGRHGYQESVIFGHAKDGNIHFLLNERFDDPALVERYVAFTEDMVSLVLGQQGTLKAEHGTGRIMAPFVRRQYGDELYQVMVELKDLCDPAGVLNPGSILTNDPLSHIANLKSSPPIDAEVDRCVECGYCEPVCPSKDLTLTPRQRIVLRREMARADNAGDMALAAELRADYEYDGIQTCAADGMCQTACPVLIDTGQLVKRLRFEQAGRVDKKLWNQAAQHWSPITRGAALALNASQLLPNKVVEGSSYLARKALGTDRIPQWKADLPSGGSGRRALASSTPDAVYFEACIGSMFGPPDSSIGAAAAFQQLCARAGIALSSPAAIGSLCCGTPWKSKGMSEGYETMARLTLASLWEATDQGRLPVVCDASSCSEGLIQMVATSPAPYSGIDVIDSITFVDTEILPRLTVTGHLTSITVHPTCSSSRLGIDAALIRLASAIAEHVVVPTDWGCCAFAGDRGLLHPELTASATAREANEVLNRPVEAHASTNRTCEIGMTRATGHTYRHILEIVDTATAKPVSKP